MVDGDRIREIFNDALEMDVGEREVFVGDVCGSDLMLRNEVTSLLKSYDRVEDFLDIPATTVSVEELAGQVLESEEASAIGKLVGAYRIEKEIGSGGMGAVFLATRDDRTYQKRVAIKLLRRGVENASIVQRFENERQILADLEHPNIARLIDGGATENGLPYFVMEYVDGSRVDHFCTERDLSIKERLKLFREICTAVEFAHQQSIVHRDIKPSNILVTKDGRPKLLDFGIAKAIVNDGATPVTATALRVMTPEYASPEQMRGEVIGKASDLYSLGVLLFQLVTGHRPYSFDSKSPLEIAQAICMDEPPKPSSIQRGLLASQPRHSAILSRDLDNIILKALRKEPERRYDSVLAFSDDIGRLLNGLPVVARRDAPFYRIARFGKRHRVPVLSALASGFAFLILGFSFSIYYASVSPVDTKGITANSAGDSYLPYERKKGGSDNAEARDLYQRAQTLWNQRTVMTIKQAAELFEQATKKDPAFALAFSGVSDSCFLMSVWGGLPPDEAFAKAREASLKAIDIAPYSAAGHLSLAIVHWQYEFNWQAADREFNRAIELEPNYVRAPHWYALFLAEMGRFDEAIAAGRRALELEPQSLPVNADLGRVLYYSRSYEESLAQYRNAIEINPNFAAFHHELSELYEAVGMTKEWAERMETLGYMDSQAKSAYMTGGIMGYRRQFIKFIQDQSQMPWYHHFPLAELHAQLGDIDQALSSLNEALRVRDHRMAQIKVNPKLDSLRSEPRFIAMLKRLRLD